MNKLLGFYELRDSMLPTIPWETYRKGTFLDSNFLWTVRTAVHNGNDLNLPRCVGATAKEAAHFADSTVQRNCENAMIVYYPYFLAEKSGTLNVFNNKIVIEAVKDDLWNLVTYSRKDVTIIISEEKNEYKNEYIGNRSFLEDKELNEIISYVKEVKRLFRDDLTEGKSVLLEWSYAYKCDIEKNRKGDCYLVFYEARTV